MRPSLSGYGQRVLIAQNAQDLGNILGLTRKVIEQPTGPSSTVTCSAGAWTTIGTGTFSYPGGSWSLSGIVSGYLSTSGGSVRTRVRLYLANTAEKIIPEASPYYMATSISTANHHETVSFEFVMSSLSAAGYWTVSVEIYPVTYQFNRDANDPLFVFARRIG